MTALEIVLLILLVLALASHFYTFKLWKQNQRLRHYLDEAEKYFSASNRQMGIVVSIGCVLFALMLIRRLRSMSEE